MLPSRLWTIALTRSKSDCTTCQVLPSNCWILLRPPNHIIPPSNSTRENTPSACGKVCHFCWRNLASPEAPPTHRSPFLAVYKEFSAPSSASSNPSLLLGRNSLPL